MPTIRITQPIDPDGFYSVRDIASLVEGISLPTLWRYVLQGTQRAGKLPSRLIGGKRVIAGADLLAFLSPQSDRNNTNSAGTNRSPSRRRRDSEKAAKRLEKLGF